MADEEGGLETKLEPGARELLTEMYSLFGISRSMELFAWAVLWGVTGVEDVKAMREDLEARGMSHTSAWRAANDFRKLKQALEDKAGRQLSVKEVAALLQKENKSLAGSKLK